MPCNNCSACLMNDCGSCKFCLDKRKFGGPGKLKKRCEMRQCLTPKPAGGNAGSNSTPNKVVTSFSIQHQKSPNNRLKSQPQQLTQSLAQQVVRNKFLTTIERKPDFEPSFGESFSSTKSLIDEDSLLAESREALENIIEMGLETFEVVNIQNDDSDRPCYICRATKLKEDLFYCSSCCVPFHRSCNGHSTGSTCSDCSPILGRKTTPNFQEAMIARAESIHAKCEQIDGAEYQVISFLSDDSEPLKMNLQFEPAAPVSLSTLTASQSSVLVDLPQVFLQPSGTCSTEVLQPNNSLQPLNDLPHSYDMDFDAYLQTISMQH